MRHLCAFLILVLTILVLTTTVVWSEESVRFESGPARVFLIELYSSEGCSSCPPADEWLNSLKDDEGLWRDFIPVAFHVDYWDYLGWKDPFASPDFTRRQRRYVSEWGKDTVYTPGFVLNGREWRRSTLPRAKGDAGHLVVEVQSDNSVSAHFKPAQSGAYTAHLTPLLFDQSSNITRGENAGRTLTHQFIATAHLEKEMINSGDALSATFETIPENTQALAVWVSRPDSQEPIQAAGGYLPA